MSFFTLAARRRSVKSDASQSVSACSYLECFAGEPIADGGCSEDNVGNRACSSVKVDVCRSRAIAPVIRPLCRSDTHDEVHPGGNGRAGNLDARCALAI